MNMEASMNQEQSVKRGGLKVRTGITAGYWTCSGVKGAKDKYGYYYNRPYAAVCYKPKNAPLFGAPAVPGGDEDL